MKLLFAVRNVAAHAEEMGSRTLTEPVFFLKPESAIQTGPELVLPTDMGAIEFEAELCVEVTKRLTQADARAAAAALGAVTVALDLTARDLQAERKKAGLPWLEAKGFDGACVLGGWTQLADGQALEGLEVRLAVNGDERQRFRVADYAVQPAELVARASRHMRLEPGDLVACGTGAGVGPLHKGDEVVAELVGIEATRIEATVAAGPPRP